MTAVKFALVPPYVRDIAVPFQVPEVMALFKKPTPDIDEKFAVAVHKEPPTPTPPVTVRTPVEVEVAAVALVTAIPPEVKRLSPMVMPEPVDNWVLPDAVLRTVPIRYLVAVEALVLT